MSLTPSGWPRPIVGGLPIPWISPSDSLTTLEPARAAACASGAVCAVCGEGYQDDEAAYVLVKRARPPKAIRNMVVHAMDNGVLHKRCLRLALKNCPELRRLQDAGALGIVKVPGNAASIERNNKGDLQAVFDGKDCEIVSPSDL